MAQLSGSTGQNLTSARRMEHTLRNSNLGIGSAQAKVLHTEKDGHKFSEERWGATAARPRDAQHSSPRDSHRRSFPGQPRTRHGAHGDPEPYILISQESQPEQRTSPHFTDGETEASRPQLRSDHGTPVIATSLQGCKPEASRVWV